MSAEAVLPPVVTSTPMMAEMPITTSSAEVFIPELAGLTISPIHDVFIGMPLSEGRAIPIETTKVMAHELGHVDVARYTGSTVIEFTATPNLAEGYLGLTVLAGHIDPAVAMAGTVATPFGAAEGYGSDVFTAINMVSDVSEIHSARSAAESIIKAKNRDLRRLEAEIACFVEQKLEGPVPGYFMPFIEARAREELKIQQNPRLLDSLNAFLGNVDLETLEAQMREHAFLKEQQIETRIIDREGGITDVITVTDGYITDEHRYCRVCQSEGGGHAPSCIYAAAQAETEEESGAPVPIQDFFGVDPGQARQEKVVTPASF